MAQTDLRFTFEVISNTNKDNNPPIQLDVISFKLEEGLNIPFLLDVELVSFNSDIDFDAVIDQPAVFTIYQQGFPVRYVHGLISDFEMGKTGFRRTRYRAIVEPSLARTRLVSDWRIFQQKNSQAILDDIFKASHIQDVEINTQLEHITREYVVQPGVLDLDFIQRLAAEEGYVYRIDSSANEHHLLLTDIIQTFGTISSNQSNQTIIYNPNAGGDRPQPALRSFTYSQRVRTTQQTQRDYTFKNPRYSLQHQVYGQNIPPESTHYERYDYGTHAKYKHDVQGKPFTTTKVQSLRNDAKVAIAIGDNATLQPGLAFELSGHTKASLNTWWRPVRIIHMGAQHTASEEESATAIQSTSYEQTAELVLATDNWKADIPPPHKIEGPLIAHVTAPKGEEIYCDEFGRVKVIFPWDRYGQPNEHSSCWIRVAQNWAGAGWGHMALPRAGQEVIVEFLGADESQPIITGRTYDFIHPTPYKLPGLKAHMTIKSKEHKGFGYNEWLVDDTTGEIKTQLHSTHGTTQLTMGYLTHPRTEDGNGEHRGNGFELRTDEWGAIRAGKGLYISTDARSQAQGNQLDLQEAITQLKNALTLAQTLAQATQNANALAVDVNDQQKQLDEVYTNLQKSGLLASAPEGVAVTTPKSVQISAENNITLTAAQNVDASSAQDYRISAGNNISLFAIEKEVKVATNKGKLHLLSQHNAMDIISQDMMSIKSTQGNVIIESKQDMIFRTVEGAYIKLHGASIELGCPGMLTLKTAGMNMIGPASDPAKMPEYQPVTFTYDAIAQKLKDTWFSG